jgi:hypothetical protein
MATKQKVGNGLEDLLGLNPGDPSAPEKIWKAVSEQFRDLKQSGRAIGAPCVDLTFYTWDHNQTGGQVEIQYNSDDWNLEKVKKDCAALKQLGFVKLAVHES